MRIPAHPPRHSPKARIGPIASPDHVVDRAVVPVRPQVGQRHRRLVERPRPERAADDDDRRAVFGKTERTASRATLRRGPPHLRDLRAHRCAGAGSHAEAACRPTPPHRHAPKPRTAGWPRRERRPRSPARGAPRVRRRPRPVRRSRSPRPTPPPGAAHGRPRYAEHAPRATRPRRAAFANRCFGLRLRTTPRPGSSTVGKPRPSRVSRSCPRADPTNSMVSRGWPASTSASAIARAGWRWPAVPPPATSALSAPRSRVGRSAPAAAGRPRATRSREAMLMRIPTAAMVMTREEPPYETNGSGMPVTGSTPTTAPTLITAWLVIQTVIPTASRLPKRSGAGLPPGTPARPARRTIRGARPRRRDRALRRRPRR